VVAPVGLLIVKVRVVPLVVLMRWLPKSASGGPAIWMSGVAPVQVRLTVRGDIGSSLTMLSVPVLAPIVVGSQRSVMVSVLPGPGDAASALSGPQLWPLVQPVNANVKFGVGSPVIVIDEMLSGMPPVLVSVRFWVTPPDAATSTVPNARLAAADRLEMAPVPETLMTLVASVGSGSLVVSVTMPLRAPTMPGTKPTCIWALPPAAIRPLRQAVPPPMHDSGNSAIDEVAAEYISAWAPVPLEMVMVWTVAALPTRVLPANVTEVGLTVRVGGTPVQFRVTALLDVAPPLDASSLTTVSVAVRVPAPDGVQRST
jgi:hypothetical protein